MDIREITARIDELANDIQKVDPVLAYALDRLSDRLEKSAAGPLNIEEFRKEMQEFFKKHQVPTDKQKKVEEILYMHPGTGRFVKPEEIHNND